MENSAIFTSLLTSQYGGRDIESNSIIKNQDELDDIISSIGSEKSPKIDFKKNQVVALFLGTRNTGGYIISIDRIEEDGDTIIIHKKVESPEGGMVTTALTNPFVIAEIHSKKQIIFK